MKQRLKILYLTFNQGGYSNNTVINRRLNKLLKSISKVPDIIVVGLQEAKDIHILEYFNRLLNYRLAYFDDFNQLLLGNMYIAIFIKYGLEYKINENYTGSERCGYSKKTIAKGCLFASITIHNIPLQFFVCHLPSDPNDFNSRDECINPIIQKHQHKKAIIVVSGDLNYRVNKTDNYKCDIKKIKDDQLGNSLKTSLNKLHLKEDTIDFCQTCRLNNNRKYDKKRIPSWCDRILYRDDDNKMKIHEYSSFDLSPTSDHMAVYSVFELIDRT